MPSSGLDGPFPLTEEWFDNNITYEQPGVYALGHTDSKGTFRIYYVGRSDDDVVDRVSDHIGRHPEFKFSYYDTPKQAFEKECMLYHEFRPPENTRHPDRPDGTNYKCPVAKCEYNKRRR